MLDGTKGRMATLATDLVIEEINNYFYNTTLPNARKQ